MLRVVDHALAGFAIGALHKALVRGCGFFVQGQQVRIGDGYVFGGNAPGLENRGQCARGGGGIAPANVKGKMRDRLGQFRRGHARVQGKGRERA
ncbi:hypothetical protein GCM10011319_42710 [Mameliella alba]|nr:hypothetical protein GCM10011319_42710 [Mameliella alba]